MCTQVCLCGLCLYSSGLSTCYHCHHHTLDTLTLGAANWNCQKCVNVVTSPRQHPPPPPAPVKRRPVGWRGGGRSSPPTRAAGHRRFEFKGLAAVRCPTPPTPHHPPSPVSRRQESAQILLLGAALQLLSILSLITVQTHEGSSWCHQLICPHYHHTPVSRTKPHLNG